MHTKAAKEVSPGTHKLFHMARCKYAGLHKRCRNSVGCRPWKVLSHDDTRLHRCHFGMIYQLQIIDKNFFLRPDGRKIRCFIVP
ncbi:hypothetical protein HanIR_Chr14g0692821 [Helianthus annuus]|nr:hypothetical protein HanIR_Chr14g0692821 [Helianthus annuus]